MSADTATTIATVNLNEIELHEGWWESDPETLRARFAFPMFWATGAASTAVLYVELEPGQGGGRHTDTRRRSCSSSTARLRSSWVMSASWSGAADWF